MGYEIGQIFFGGYPPEAAIWCNANNAMIVQMGDKFEIRAVPPIGRAEAIKQEIAAFEAQQTDRRMRDAALTDAGKAWLQNLENQISAKRAELAGL